VAIQKPEWFKIDAAKFLSDTLVDAMSSSELGACLRLLCRQWMDGYIPDDLHRLARLCRLDDASMADAWIVLSEFFPAIEPGKRANRFMWLERERVVADLARKSDEGTRAARKRWDEVNNMRNAAPIAKPNGSPMPEPMQDQTRVDQTREGAVAPAPPLVEQRRPHQMPKDFRPDAGHQILAADLCVDLETAFLAFRDHHLSKGSKFKDWGHALNTWLRRESKFQGQTAFGKAGAAAITGSAVENTLDLLKGGAK
jgi:uncharacterized protein YdaU (DUF1376 family)